MNIAKQRGFNTKNSEYCDFKNIEGHIVIDVRSNDDCVEILTKTHLFELLHNQDCCESVWLDDICGDLSDLIGQTINVAEESCSNDDEADESGTWTFYKIRTTKTSIDLTWRGQSNGYYSESVDCRKSELF